MLLKDFSNTTNNLGNDDLPLNSREDMKAEDWIVPSTPAVEGAIARLTPVYQKLYAADQSLLDSAKRGGKRKGEAGKQDDSPPTEAEMVQATFRRILASMTSQEMQMLSSLLPAVPKRPPNVGGHEKLKRTLLSTLAPAALGMKSYHSSELLAQPKGVLLYGPSGTGKTHISGWVRYECWQRGVPFLCVGPGSFYSKFVGETSVRVRTFFSMCSKLNAFNDVHRALFGVSLAGGYKKTVVFVDEVDGLFRDRNGGGAGVGEGSEVYRDFKTEFMSMWDGVEEGSIVVVGASNRPYDIDEAFQRRMPRSFLIGLPAFSHRLKVLQSLTSEIPTHAHCLRGVAKQTEGFSASDLKELTRIAAQRWVEKGEKNGGIGERDFEDAIDTYSPTGFNARGYQRDVEHFESAMSGNGDGGGGVMGNMANAFSSMFRGDSGAGMWGGGGEGGDEETGDMLDQDEEEDVDDLRGMDTDDDDVSSDDVSSSSFNIETNEDVD